MQDKDDKVETSRLHFKCSEKNNDALTAFDYRKKMKGKENGEYLKPYELTEMKLDYIDKFPKDIDIRVFSDLIRDDCQAKDWLSTNLSKKLDLSNEKRDIHYNGRIETEQAGWMSEMRDRYFYNAYGDTLLVACTLLAIEADDELRTLRYRFKRDIWDIKEYLENIEYYFEESIEGIFEAILSEDISGAKAHIYINFIYEVVVEKNNSMNKYIVKYNEEFKEALSCLSDFKTVKIEEVSKKQIEEIERYL